MVRHLTILLLHTNIDCMYNSDVEGAFQDGWPADPDGLEAIFGGSCC
jgi:hypothetical protein